MLTPVYAMLCLSGWHGASAQLVAVVGQTPARYRVRAIDKTRLAGRGRWLQPGQEALVSRTSLRFGEWSTPAWVAPTPTGAPIRGGST